MYTDTMTKVRRFFDIKKSATNHSLILLGPRQTGKSMLLRDTFPESPYYNLLHTDVFYKLQREPSRLRQEILAHKNIDGPIIIDEIQKLPILLDEVQGLIDANGISFIVTGSSARKLKAGGANLLGGRARMKRLFPFVYPELKDYSITRAIERGLLPPIWFSDESELDLRAYCGMYLKEEIQAESLVRGLEGFSRFLTVAGLMSGHELNFENIARDCAVPARTVREYVSVLTDTLIATQLEPWKTGYMRKPVSRSKLFIFDLGVARVLAGKRSPQQDSAEWGQALEQLVYQELRAWLEYTADFRDLCYWRTYDNKEVDFIVGNDLAIEVKASRRIVDRDLKGLRDINDENKWKARILVCQEDTARLTEDGILILPVLEFFERLWSGEWRE